MARLAKEQDRRAEMDNVRSTNKQVVFHQPVLWAVLVTIVVKPLDGDMSVN